LRKSKEHEVLTDDTKFAAKEIEENQDGDEKSSTLYGNSSKKSEANDGLPLTMARSKSL
jgi:hypothetical protein